MMKRFAGLLAAAALGLGLTLAGSVARAQATGATVVTDLIAGQFTKVGTVTATYTPGNVRVTYQITQGTWKIEDVHLCVADNVADIPQKNGNPAPGQFPIKATLTNATSYSVDVPFNCPPDHQITIASHAVVNGSGGTLVTGTPPKTLDEWITGLPTIGATTVTYQLPGDPSYLIAYIEGGELSGAYEAWCVDAEYGIPEDVHFDSAVVCSYDPRAVFLVPRGENWPQINWLLNQNFVGQRSPAGGRYTMGDVQKAIWAIVDTTTSENFVDPYNQARVDLLVSLAHTNGATFVPSVTQKVVMIAVPSNLSSGQNVAQTHIFAVPWSTDGGGGGGGGGGGSTATGRQTAWGGNSSFAGKNWALYFTLNCP